MQRHGQAHRAERPLYFLLPELPEIIPASFRGAPSFLLPWGEGEEIFRRRAEGACVKVVVITGLVPVISLRGAVPFLSGMAGTSPAMTKVGAKESVFIPALKTALILIAPRPLRGAI